MLIDVIAVESLPDYHLHLMFKDGVEGVVDFREMTPFMGVFEPLNDPAYFAQVRVHPEFGVICWPNDADCDSEVLYAKVTGTYEELMRGERELAQA